MTGYATLQALINDLNTDDGMDRNWFLKSKGTQTVRRGYTFWQQAGIPGSGSNAYAIIGTGSAIMLSGSEPRIQGSGSVASISPVVATEKTYLIKFGVGHADTATTIPGTYLLCDRLCQVTVTGGQATANFSPIANGSARLAPSGSGRWDSGGQLIMETTTALGAVQSGAYSFNIYDREGKLSTTSSVWTSGGSAVDVVPTHIWFFVPLSGDDRGVRAITGINRYTATSTGSFTVALVKPIAWLGHPMFMQYNEKEFVVQLQNLVPLNGDECLCLYQIPITAATTAIHGQVVVSQE